MELWDYYLIAYKSLTSNKFRTFLTTLGIIIGVMSVVTLLSIGRGAQASIENSFNSFGSNNIFATPGEESERRGGPPNLSDSFKISEVDRLYDYPKKYIDAVAAQVTGQFQIYSDFTDDRLTVQAYYGDYAQVYNIEIDKGRLFDKSDADQRSKVVLIGPDLVDDLFDGQNPLGKEIKIGSEKFTIIGIVKSKGSSGFDNPDKYIYTPFNTYSRYLVKRNELSFVAVRAKDKKYAELAKDELKTILRRIRNVREGDADNFSVRDAGEILSTINQFTSIFTAFMASIAAISLLVGGIGVMNIMFVSITERTKEIGLRKSLGATNRDVLMQFLIESIAMTVLGGSVGIIIGILISTIASRALDLPTGIYWNAVLLALGFSVVIGFVFGIYPARKAAKLSPIDALRYE